MIRFHGVGRQVAGHDGLTADHTARQAFQGDFPGIQHAAACKRAAAKQLRCVNHTGRFAGKALIPGHGVFHNGGFQGVARPIGQKQARADFHSGIPPPAYPHGTPGRPRQGAFQPLGQGRRQGLAPNEQRIILQIQGVSGQFRQAFLHGGRQAVAVVPGVSGQYGQAVKLKATFVQVLFQIAFGRKGQQGRLLPCVRNGQAARAGDIGEAAPCGAHKGQRLTQGAFFPPIGPGRYHSQAIAGQRAGGLQPRLANDFGKHLGKRGGVGQPVLEFPGHGVGHFIIGGQAEGGAVFHALQLFHDIFAGRGVDHLSRRPQADFHFNFRAQQRGASPQRAPGVPFALGVCQGDFQQRAGRRTQQNALGAARVNFPGQDMLRLQGLALTAGIGNHAPGAHLPPGGQGRRPVGALIPLRARPRLINHLDHRAFHLANRNMPPGGPRFAQGAIGKQQRKICEIPLRAGLELIGHIQGGGDLARNFQHAARIAHSGRHDQRR